MPLRPGIAILLAGLTVAGCASVESVLGPMGNIFSSTPNPPAQQGPVQINERADEAAPYASGPTRTSDVDCPQVTVRTGAATWQIPPGTGPTNIRYQASLGQLARECAVLGDSMTIRVGIEGRVLVGPKGGPGAVSIPVRIAVIQEGPQPRTLWTKFYSIPVSVAQGTTQAAFAQVEDDVTFQLPGNRGELAAYVIYVGFDPQGATPARATKQKAAPKAAPKQAKAKPKAKAAPKGAPPPAPPPQQQFAPPPGTFAPPPPPPAR
jgi:hypothetical protein